MKYLLILAVFSTASVLIVSADIDDCIHKDSIACVQIEVFRKMKSYFDQDKIELFGGLALTKRELDADQAARNLKEDGSVEDEIVQTKDIEVREDALEQFAITRVSRLLDERSLTWNLTPLVSDVTAAARSLSDSIPTEIKDGVSNFINEGRGKKKKLLKALLPLLIGLKMKLGGFMVLAYFVIALIAKKALIASLIALAISGFIAIKKLLSQQQQHMPHHEVHEVAHGWAGPSYGGGGGGGYSSGGWDSYGGSAHDSHGAYSSNVAHTLAYSGQKPASR
ncbi:hypothetical protein O3M35_012319 [Rhynocoris fuscipes]|uniref:Uncharacterized protein n=1 Tax=Rhynocoris fuscipes TaxID=488301 RepID=A0AAW1CT72_9HEMI